MKREGEAAALGVVSVIIPGAVGCLLATGMHNATYAGPSGRSGLAFGLFVGACISVTALPVIAHMLLERGELNSRVGSVALTASAVSTVVMFVFVALAITVSEDRGYGPFLLKLALIAIAGVAARFLGKPAVRRSLQRNRLPDGGVSTDAIAIVFGGMLLFALAADRLGISALVGAFVWGLVMPDDPDLRRRLGDRLRDVTTVLLLPVFFTFAGLSADLRLLSARVLPLLLVVLVAAVASKLVAAIPAKLYGMSWREAGALGAMMNTRGLVLLVVGLIGLDSGLITAATYAILVLVALATNVMAGPLMDAFGMSSGAAAPARATAN